MPKIQLTASFVKKPKKPNKKTKVNYFDTSVPGLLLEVRQSGKSTFYFRYRDKVGKSKQIRLGSPLYIGLEEARDKARILKSQAVMGFDPRAEIERIKSVPTFKEFVYEQYLPYVKTYKRSWIKDKQFLELRVIKLWGKLQMHEVKAKDVVIFQNVLIEAGLRPGTVNRCMALIKYIFNLAEKWEIIDRAPTKNIKTVEDNGHRERYLSEDELRRLLETLGKVRSKVVPDVIELLVLTGARKSEVLGLQWSEVDMEQGVWVLPAERNKGKRSKTIPLSNAALDVLKRREGNGSQYVFPNRKTGEPIKDIYDTWEWIVREAGLPGLRIHDLRHNFASLLVNSGRSLYEVQKLLGHSQLTTTQRYAHLSRDTLKVATNFVGDQVGNLKK